MMTAPRTEPARSGVVVVDKPAGWTSHQVVARVRRLAGTRKVGHAGTLDPMATGVLLVGVERATRLLGHLTLTAKEYHATIRLGVATVTDDAEGEVTHTVGAADVTDAQILAQMAAFRGDITQRPSSVSAIKVDGVRAYSRVRAGEEVALAARPVTISRYDVCDIRRREVDHVAVVDLDVQVECSSGTYIRALARDLGGSLGLGGHLTQLRRTRVGPFGLSQAQSLETAADGGLDLLDMAEVARRSFPVVRLDAKQAQWVSHGRRLPDFPLVAPTTALVSAGGELLALYRPSGDDAVAISVFTS